MPNNDAMKNYDNLFYDDKLDIKSNVIDFAHLIEQDTYKASSTSKVYSISSEFGTGKTFFCDKLQSVLTEDKVKVGKLNIWEMDFYENPLIPILAELNKLYSSKGKKLPSKILTTVGKFSSRMISALCEISTKIVSNEILGVDAVEVCKDKFSPETIYCDYNEYQNALKELKKSLKDWSSRQRSKPIVIIIDELDRCKPDYAVKTLEVLKHFFDVPGFVFVLAIDEEQIKNSVQTLFGTINYEGYKRKFINNSFLLPKPNRLAFTEYLYEKSDLHNYIEQIQKDKRELVFTIDIYNVYCCDFSYSEYGSMNKQDLAKQFNQTQTSESIIKRYFAAYSESLGFSLRKMEQVFDRLILFIKQINTSNEIFSPDLATFLICLHEADLEIFEIVKRTKNIANSIIKQAFGNNVDSYAYNIYKEEAFKKFKDVNRNIVPEVMPVVAYSYIINTPDNKPRKIISDNVDRFYISDGGRWLYQQNAINTRGILTNKSDFNVENFKHNYCNHIDFIAHFE